METTVTFCLSEARYWKRGDESHGDGRASHRTDYNMSLILSILIGAGLGAGLGYFGKCSSGTCPLTANWWRGALYGAVLGFLFHSVATRNGSTATESTQNVQTIQEQHFASEVTQATGPVVVDFYATWCGPCKRLSPMLDDLAGPLTNSVKFYKVDVDKYPNLARQFDIQGVPTLLFFDNGKVVDKIVGLPSKEALQTKLNGLATSKALSAAAK